MADLSEMHNVFDQGQRPIKAAWDYLEKQYEAMKDDLQCFPPYYKLFVEERYEELKRRADNQILVSSPKKAEALLESENTNPNPLQKSMEQQQPKEMVDKIDAGQMEPQATQAGSETLTGFAELDAFFESLNAATAGLPSQAEKVQQLKDQAMEMEAEENAAIASITPKMTI